MRFQATRKARAMASGELAGDDALVMAHSVHGKLDLIRSEVQQILANQALLLEAAGVRPAPPRKVSLVVPGNVPELPPVGVPLKATVVAQGGKTVHLELQDFGSQIYQHRMDSLEDAANLSQATVILQKTMGHLRIQTVRTCAKRRRRAPRSDREEEEEEYVAPAWISRAPKRRKFSKRIRVILFLDFNKKNSTGSEWSERNYNRRTH